MKRFQLPLRKGTELLPSTSQQPTKLIIRGVPAGSPLYSAVAGTYAGRLKQFHGRQQQAYSLSLLPMHKARADLGGAIAIYSNINGQEVLELEVSVAVIEQLLKAEAKAPKTPISWALIELTTENFLVTYVVDDFGNTFTGIYEAFVYFRVKGTTDWISSGGEWSAEDPPLLQTAPGLSDDIVIRDEPLFPFNPPNYVTSLLVDMRKRTSDLSIELWGGIGRHLATIDGPSLVITPARSAQLNSVGVIRDVQWQASFDDDSLSIPLWEEADIFPARPPLRAIADLTVPSITGVYPLGLDPGTYEHFLGTINISADHGSIGFTPA